MIFGVRAVIEAIQAGKEIDKVLVKKDIQSDLSRELFAALKGTFIPVQRVPVERLNRITRKNHQGVVAYVSAVAYQKVGRLGALTCLNKVKSLSLSCWTALPMCVISAPLPVPVECAAVDAVIIPARNSVTVNADAVKNLGGSLAYAACVP